MALVTPSKMKVRYLDLAVADEAQRRELLAAVDAVLRHGRLVLGPEVEEFERQVAQRCGRAYAVGVCSGTGALYFGLKSLDIGAGDEVITTPMSFIATANAIAAAGATPVFADIGEDLNLDPTSIEPLITPRTKAIMPVHYTGRLCRMPQVMQVAQRHKLLVIEDASQAFSAGYREQVAGGFGDIGCISMNPMKVLSALGEAGAVVTDRQDVRDRLVALRYNGLVNREDCREVSLNGRLDTIQAAMLLTRLPRVDAWVARRRQVAARYIERLRGLVELPVEHEGYRDVYYTFTIRTPRREELRQHLEECGVEGKVYHPLLMPQHTAYATPGRRGQFPNAQRLVRQILCLPVHEKLTDDEVEYVCQCVRGFFGA